MSLASGSDHPLGLESLSAASLAQQALDGLAAHVCMLDEHGTVLVVNRAWREYGKVNGGDDCGTIEGSNYLRVCDCTAGDELADANAFSTQLREVLRGEKDGFELEYPCHAPDKLIWFVASVSRLLGSGPTRVVVSHQPVTERRLAVARQVEAQRLQSLGSLAGGVAHDFNNVLGAVLGNSVVALSDLEADHPARPAVQRIQTAGERARQLVRRILRFARGGTQLPQVQALRPLVEEALAMLRLSVPAGVQLTASLTDQPLWARVDNTDLQQALMNLVHNGWHALKGRQGGQVVVGLQAPGLAAASEQQGMAHLWVSDDGCGMSEALMSRMFEPFFTTRGPFEGTGLGLGQVEQAAQRMQARLTVKSELGQGSTFHLWIPLCKPAQQNDNPQAQAEAGSVNNRPAAGSEHLYAPRTPALQPAGPLRVLLVDDDEVVALTLSFMLERAGYVVTVCNGGPEALRHLVDPAQALDVIVTDQNMPELSGLELCRLARALRPELPLVLVSGSLVDAVLAELSMLRLTAAVAKEDMAQALLPAMSLLLAPALQALRTG